ADADARDTREVARAQPRAGGRRLAHPRARATSANAARPLAPRTLAVTTKPPGVARATSAGATATPPASVVTSTVRRCDAKRPLAPAAGAVNVTTAPA